MLLFCVSSTKMEAPWGQGLSLFITVSPAPPPALCWYNDLYNEYSTITFNCLLYVSALTHPKLKCFLSPKILLRRQSCFVAQFKECQPQSIHGNGPLPPPSCALHVDSPHGCGAPSIILPHCSWWQLYPPSCSGQTFWKHLWFLFRSHTSQSLYQEILLALPLKYISFSHIPSHPHSSLNHYHYCNRPLWSPCCCSCPIQSALNPGAKSPLKI